LAEVGNFDALNNNQGSHDHYTNLSTDHADKAIIKLQLRPQTEFNTWVAAIGNGTANLETVVEKVGEDCAYYGDTEMEANEGTFLNDATGFSVENRNFYEIYSLVFRERTNNRNYYNENPYNFLRPITNTNPNRKKIAYLCNNNSTEVVFFIMTNMVTNFKYQNVIELL
jgi:hypothetical protein